MLAAGLAGPTFGDTPKPPVAASGENLVISEIMYHPAEPTPDEAGDVSEDAEDFEFIELMNISEDSVDLSRVAFTDGIAFEFSPDTVLEAGKRAVLVKHRGAFEKRYGSKARVLGLYEGNLKNSGEKVILEDAQGNTIVSVSFKDNAPWPQSPDGLGFSLVLKNPEKNPSPNQAGNWAASSALGGSPGEGDAETAGGIVITEVLTHTDPPEVDAIELHNPTGEDVDISGWYLTDDRLKPDSYKIVEGTKIPAGGYWVIKGDTDGDPTNNDSLPAEYFGRSFSLSSHGEEIFLFAADASGNLTGYTHGFDFPAGANGVSFGRHLNSAGKEEFPPQSRVTLGASNAGPRKPLVVISEIMYHPDEEDVEEEGEFVEIWNWSQQSVPLFDPLHPENTWQLTAVKFTFPRDQTLKPNEVAIISKLAPQIFRKRYKIPDSVKVFGPLEDVKLSNSGERVRLLRPDAPDLENGETFVPMLQVDAVRYTDRDPWPEEPDGGGVSLERDPEAVYSDDPASWKASTQENGTPGSIPGQTDA